MSHNQDVHQEFLGWVQWFGNASLQADTGGGTTPQPKTDLELSQLADDFGVVFAGAGIPEIAGRILGWLLVCDPEEQSLDQLRVATQASKASISTMTRLLLHLGFIERTGGGERGMIRYRLGDDPWTSFSEKRLETTRRLVKLTRDSVESLSGMPAPRRRRVEQARRFWSYVLERHEVMMDEWKRFNARWESRSTQEQNGSRGRRRRSRK